MFLVLQNMRKSNCSWKIYENDPSYLLRFLGFITSKIYFYGMYGFQRNSYIFLLKFWTYMWCTASSCVHLPILVKDSKIIPSAQGLVSTTDTLVSSPHQGKPFSDVTEQARLTGSAGGHRVTEYGRHKKGVAA